MSFLLRDAIDEPGLICSDAHRSRLQFIDILHPGYGNTGDHDKSDILISFPALDDGGIDYHTAHTACAILVGNRWDGYFSSHVKGDQKCSIPNDGILRADHYYFHLPTSSVSSPDPYPVIPRFSDWRFPHQNLPSIWSRLQECMDAEDASIDSSGRCCMSNYCEAVESAHLVPAAQSDWWSNNSMTRYGPRTHFSTDPINAPANFLPLRSDIHKVFDERHLTFVPKAQVVTANHSIKHKVVLIENRNHRQGGGTTNISVRDGASVASQEYTELASDASTSQQRYQDPPPEQIQPQLVGHVFNSTPSGQLPKLWHNRSIHKIPPWISVECLFARFAWTIFSPTVFCDFLCATGKDRYVMVWDRESNSHKVESASPERCRAIFNAARSRSESPKKRSRAAGDLQLGSRPYEDSRDSDHGSQDESDVDSGYHDDLGWKMNLKDPPWSEELRGRTRKREFKETEADCL